jgi:hypothetical protein
VTHHPQRTEEICDSLRTYVGYLEDLSRVEFDGASTKLRLVVNYARKDLVLRALGEVLHTRFTSERFLEEVMGGTLHQPDHPVDRMAYVSMLLLQLKQGWKLNLREVLTRPELSGGGLDQRWGRLCKEFVEPFRADLAKLNTWVSAHLADRRGELADPLGVFNEGLEACFGLAPSTSVPRPTPPAVAVSAGFAPLERALGGLDADLRADLSVDLGLLQLERSKSRPSAARIDELLGSFGAAGLREAARACVTDGTATALVEPPAAPPAAAPAPAPPAQQAEAPRGAVTPAEREELRAERKALAAERRALVAQRAALTAESVALAAEREALQAERQALEASRRAAEESP